MTIFKQQQHDYDNHDNDDDHDDVHDNEKHEKNLFVFRDVKVISGYCKNTSIPVVFTWFQGIPMLEKILVGIWFFFFEC